MPDTVAPAILDVEGLCLRDGASAIDAVIREGEIVGLAGLDGHGQEEFLETLCGLRQPISGSVKVQMREGKTAVVRNFHGAVDAGVAYLPRDRKTEGILPSLSVFDNFRIGTLTRSSRFGFLDVRAEKAQLEQFRERLCMVYSSPSAPITSLSGGNQQKVLLARWMAAAPRVMLLNDPTRGVDVGTRLLLYRVFKEMAANDRTTLVLLSTEIEELLQLCDRVLIFRDGTVFSELQREAMSMGRIMAGMFGREDGN